MAYKTKQREYVLNAMQESGRRHVTAAELVHMLQDSGKSVGLATVYRNLEQLVEEGLVRKYTLDERTGACYQYVGKNGACQNHFHLKCVRCGELFHVDCAYMNDLGTHLLKEHDFAIDHTKTVLYGVCGKCREKEGR